MPRILAIDYGLKRTGLAWTDPLQIIATAVGTVDTPQLKEKLAELMASEAIEALLLGWPTRFDGSDTHATPAVREFEAYLKATYPQLTLHLWDERFTSKMAQQALRESGLKKKKRREKGLVDQVAATLMLQEFLQSQG
jgi:putative holliday junction resolvase